MEWWAAGGLMISMVLLFMGLGIPVAFTFFAANAIGGYIFMGRAAGVEQLVENSTDMVTSFSIAPLPLFILMGELFFHSGIARRVFDAMDRLLGRLPGRLCYLSIGMGTASGAVLGSSMASTAMLGSLLVPEMIRRGYRRYMIFGPIVGCGGLAMIIPPSTMTVLLGTIAEVNIGALLIGSIMPGLLLAVLYVFTVMVQLTIAPNAAPAYQVEFVPWQEKVRLLAGQLIPVGFIVFCVTGTILFGLATPSEAAALGALGTFALATAYRQLTWQVVVKSFIGTARVTGMTLLVLMGSSLFSQILAFSGAANGFIQSVTSYSLQPYAILLLMFVVIFILGMLMDGLSIYLLTVPIFFPLAKAIGFDPVWYGIWMLIAVEIGLATPPFGLGLYIMLGVAPGSTLGEVSRAVVPYILATCLLLALMVLFPALVLYLPGTLR